MAGSQTSQLQITGLTPGSLHHSYATNAVVSAHSGFSDNSHKQGTERVQALADISRSRYVVTATKPVYHCKSAQ